MAKLSDSDRFDIWAEIMRQFSAAGIEIPVPKVALRTLVDRIDEGLEIAETSIVTSLPAGDGRAWLIAHQSIGRAIMAYVEQRRKEVL